VRTGGAQVPDTGEDQRELMTTTTHRADDHPLLHPRLARLDPSRQVSRRHGSRLGVLAGTLGACLTITFAAHALHGPLTVASPQAARTLAEPAQVLVSAI
jgi:hypothetical protein